MALAIKSQQRQMARNEDGKFDPCSKWKRWAESQFKSVPDSELNGVLQGCADDVRTLASAYTDSRDQIESIARRIEAMQV